MMIILDVTSCNINIMKLAKEQALIIDDSDHRKFRYPCDKEGNIMFAKGEPVHLACSGENNFLKNVPGKPQFLTVKCVYRDVFEANGSNFFFDDYVCERPPEYSIVEVTQYLDYKIGFYTDSEGSFLETINIKKSETDPYLTAYARSTVPMSIAAHQVTAKNRRFDQKYCCDILRRDLDSLYRPEIQEMNMELQFSRESFRKLDYFDKTDKLFNKGHLTPKSTFVYSSAGISSFVYLNTAPQWKRINARNWAFIEVHVNKIADKLQRDLTVYTGTLGQLFLEDFYHNMNTSLPIYFLAERELKMFPVPQYFWKLVYSPEDNTGIVFITSNNPYATVDEIKQHKCSNPIINEHTGKSPAKWKPKQISDGYSYFCTIADFVKFNGITFDDFPSASGVTDLLLIRRGKILSIYDNNDIHNELKK